MMTDQRLLHIIDKAIRGDGRAFTELCRLKGRDILYISMKLMGDAQDGEDAAQEILIHMHDHISDLREAKAFNVWLYRLMRGICSNMKRQKKDVKTDMAKSGRKGPWTLEEFLPDDLVKDSEKQKILLRLIDDLSENYRMCVFLFYYEKMQYEEIAVSLDMTWKEVDNALTRARQRIRAELARSREKEKYLEKALAVSPVPVFVSAFNNEMHEMVSEQCLDQFVHKSELLAGGTAIGGGTFARGFVDKEAGKLTAGGSASNIPMGVFVLASSLVIGGAVFFSRREEPIQGHNSSPAVMEEQVTQRPSASEPQDEDYDIKTLEDMLGEVDAKQLRLLADAPAVSRQEAEVFLELEIGMGVEEGVWNPVSMEEHTVYSLVKKEKLLLVILKYDAETAHCRIAFQFSEADTEWPEDVKIPIYFEAWKAEGSDAE